MFRFLQERQHGFDRKVKLYNESKDNLDFLQRLKLDQKLEVHSGCVNTICWNTNGHYILSGSDDQHLKVTNPFSKKQIYSIRSGHRSNIFSAQFLPNSCDKKTISCSGDGKIFYTNFDREDLVDSCVFNCHFGTTYEVAVIQNEPFTFLSCGEDGCVRWFDLRLKTSCNKEMCKDDVLINCNRAVTALASNPYMPYQLAVACSDSSVRLFDRRMLGTRATGNYTGRGIQAMMCRFTAPNLSHRSYRITSLNYSLDGEDILVSYSSEHIYLFGHKRNTYQKLDIAPKPVEKTDTGALKIPEYKREMKPEEVATCTSSPTPHQKESVPEVTSQEIECNNDQDHEQAEGGSLLDPDQDENPMNLEDPLAGHPPIKRLRLRGDWSDTGPQARPESERQPNREDGRSSPHASIMQRMSDMLTRWVYGNVRQGRSSSEGPTSGPLPGASSQDIRPAPHSLLSRRHLSDSEGSDSDLAVDEHSGLRDSYSDNATGSPRREERKTEQTPIDSVEKHSRTSGPESTKANDSNVSLSTTSSEVNSVPQSDLELSVSSDFGASADTQASSEYGNSFPERSANSDLKPVINLQYSSEGTTNSTVTLGFANLENLHEHDSSSAVSAGRGSSSHVNIFITPEDPSAMDVHSQNASEQSESANTSFSSLPDIPSPVCVQGDLSMSSESSWNDHSSCVNTSVESPLQNQTTSSSSHSIQANDGQINCGDSSGSTGSEEKEPKLCGLGSDYEHNSTSDLQQSDKVSSANNTVANTSNEFLEERTQGKSEEHASMLKETQIGVGTGSLDTSVSSVCQSDTKESNLDKNSEHACGLSVSSELQEGLEKQTTNGTLQSNESETVASTTSLPEQTLSVSSKNNSEQTTSAEASVNSNPDEGQGRQRRIGVSDRGEPPEPNTTDDDDESGSRDRSGRDTLERHITAVRLQELYRRRQEQREKDEMELRNIHQPKFKMVFKGHRNSRTMIKEANFWGNKYVMSGSDCGHIFFWDRYTGELVFLLEGDRHVVNCLQPHPIHPVLASSGIDYDIKIWSPLEEQPLFDVEKTNELVHRNEVMFEETRDTITVPAAFMIRVLASINQYRSGRQNNPSDDPPSPSADP